MVSYQKIEDEYKARNYIRYDDTGIVRYFSAADFQGLKAEPYRFPSSLGHAMQGYFYSYQGADESRLIVFEHGIGGGHRSYMKEIEKLCAAGFLVFAYDHTGCMDSGGENINGFAQSIHDLDDCLHALKKDAAVDTSDLCVMGHSWGGLSTLNIPALHPDVKRIVALCGFVSMRQTIEQTYGDMGEEVCARIMCLERDSNPAYVDCDAVETLQKADVKALLIYSDDDAIVQKKYHYDLLHAALEDRENVEMLLVSGKGHNPHYTAEAVAQLGVLAQRLQSEGATLHTAQEKAAFRDSFNWDAMTRQDEAIWSRIIDFLKK